VNTRRRLAAACLLLTVLSTVTGCGLNAAGDPAEESSSAAAPTGSAQDAPVSALAPAFGRPHTYPGGLTVKVSQPKGFIPSRTANPQVKHAVSVEITVANGTSRTYRLSSLSIVASVNGEPSRELIDSTQGYTGIVDASTDVPPSRKITVLLAFGSDAVPTTASLRIRPGRDERAAAQFTGAVSG